MSSYWNDPPAITQTICEQRYFTSEEIKQCATPPVIFDRVATALALVEPEDKRGEWFMRFFNAMVDRKFLPGGRTLANAGTPQSIVANCIVLVPEDTIESIYETLWKAVKLQKAGSGLGFPFSELRPAAFPTVSMPGQASGPVSFLKVYDVSFGVIKQQNRHGANMGIMNVDHPDILEFVHCKEQEGTIRNFNISVALTDEFMERAVSNDPRPWVCKWDGIEYAPRRITRDRNFVIKEIVDVNMTPREILSEIAEAAWRNGEPGVVFVDTANKQNPLPCLGPLKTTNPCGEQWLHHADVCNLGAINLAQFVNEDMVKFELLSSVRDDAANDAVWSAYAKLVVEEDDLRETARVAVRMLDNVIDCTNFPVEDVNVRSRETRRIGLGIMGLADALMKAEVAYDSPIGRKVAVRMLEIMDDESEKMSIDLAKEKGAFPLFGKSTYARGEPRRNCALLTVAPTGTTALVFNVSGGVEPYFALAYGYDKNAVLDGKTELSMGLNPILYTKL
ncbi:MAG: adenosylcobalamin-dependent ribonucleoside-diphosphate reductase, partial [Alphaproteobacteria bacterium]